MRTIFITDIHGHYSKFASLLGRINYDPAADTLILGGDYFDRGRENHLMARWLVENHTNPLVHLIRGNHDDFMIDLFDGDHSLYQFNYKNNGFKTTIANFAEPSWQYDPDKAAAQIRKKEPQLESVFQGLVNYVEIRNYVYTHGALPMGYKTLAEDDPIWREARWANSEMFAHGNQLDVNVVIGHWYVQGLPQYNAEKHGPITIRNVTFCDSGFPSAATLPFAFIVEN